MWELKESCFELVLRATLLYAMLLVLFRLKNRAGGEVSPIDQVVLFTIGDLVGTAAVNSDSSMAAAMIVTATFVGLSGIVGFVSFKSRKASRLIEGSPTILVHNGQILWKNMEKECVNRKELMEALREAGVASISRVHAAFMETNGQISVIERSSKAT